MTNSSGSARRGPPRIAVDAMGGDYAPSEVVKGAVEAAHQLGVHILLVGDQEEVEAQLKQHNTGGASITAISSEGKITEEEHPVQGLRGKPRASIAVATSLVKNGKADGLVTMGSTGAAMASATLVLGLFEGLERPCLGGPFLGLAAHTAILDVGSNVDCRPQQLLSFAVMGCVFARKFFKVENPRVGLLSVGTEEAKGNRQVRESYQLFRESSLSFIGNVEGMDLLTGKAHVIVCDGFVGNIVMKFAEGLGDGIASYLRDALKGKLPDEELDTLYRDVWELTNLAKKMGGPLFGVNGIVVIGHGASKGNEVASAIETAKRCIELDLAESIKQELAVLRASMKI